MSATVAAWTGMDLDAERGLGCVYLAIQYLASGAEHDVVATAQVLRRGRDLAFLEAVLRSASGTELCRGLVTYRASDYGGRAPRLRAEHVPLPAPSPLMPPAASRLFRGYVAELGMAPVHESPGRVRLCMPCTPAHLDEQGRMHAGTLASVVDIAAVAASWSLVPRRPGSRGSTIAMQVSFPSTTKDAVIADAHVQQRSESLLFSTVHVTAETSGQLVAMGQVSYRLLEPWPDSSPSGA
jgi:acyl-coenzyme A thioesterase PaaI-like protein